jgi:hypothetical protein
MRLPPNKKEQTNCVKIYCLPILFFLLLFNAAAQKPQKNLTGRWVGSYGNNEKKIRTIFHLLLGQTVPLLLTPPTTKCTAMENTT